MVIIGRRGPRRRGRMSPSESRDEDASYVPTCENANPVRRLANLAGHSRMIEGRAAPPSSTSTSWTAPLRAEPHHGRAALGRQARPEPSVRRASHDRQRWTGCLVHRCRRRSLNVHVEALDEADFGAGRRLIHEAGLLAAAALKQDAHRGAVINHAELDRRSSCRWNRASQAKLHRGIDLKVAEVVKMARAAGNEELLIGWTASGFPRRRCRRREAGRDVSSAATPPCSKPRRPRGGCHCARRKARPMRPVRMPLARGQWN